MNNLIARLDILHTTDMPHQFTLQVFDKTTQQFLAMKEGTVGFVILDARGNYIGNPTFGLDESGNKAFFDIAQSVPIGYTGSLKYKIMYTEPIQDKIMYLLCGSIDCVDMAHIPVHTSQYIPNSSNVIIEADLSTATNVTVEVQNGVPGPAGTFSMKAVEFSAVEDNGIYSFATATFDMQVNLLVNLTGADGYVNFTMSDSDTMPQGTDIYVGKSACVAVYRIGSTLYYNLL